MSKAEALRRELANGLREGGSMQSEWVREAFTDIPRENFVPRFFRKQIGSGGNGRTALVDGGDPNQRDEWLRGVYADEVLVVQLAPAPDIVDPVGVPTSSSSMPTVMAGMLEVLDLRPEHRVLEIGTGTGYNAALLCHRVGEDHVVSVELDPVLGRAAGQALADVGLHPTVHIGDGAAVLPGQGPFDRIIATAAADHIPPAWITQLAPGGMIVVDLRGSLDGSLVRLARTGEDKVEGKLLDLPGAFMPMRRQIDNPHRNGESWDRVLDQINPHCGSTAVNPSVVADIRPLRFMTQLHFSGQRLRGFVRDPDQLAVSGRDTKGSWFSVQSAPEAAGLYRVKQGGPQRLWDTVEASVTAWHRLGEPGITRFGITAYDHPALQYVWFDHPESGLRWPLPL